MSKILVIYTSIGKGHKVVAQNIAQQLKKHPGLEVTMLDILKFYQGSLTSGGEGLYKFILRKLPWLWSFFYTNKAFLFIALKLRQPFASRKTYKLEQYLNKNKPDLVLTTQTTATALMSDLKLKGKYKGKLATAFSDFHFHPFWAYPGVDKYLGVIPEHKTQIQKLLGAGREVAITGLAVDEVFNRDYSTGEVCEQFALSKTKPIILIMGGSRGWGIKLADIKALLELSHNSQLVVLCGDDEELKIQIEKLNKSQPTKLVAWTNLQPEEVAKLFSVSRLLITKPGGLTIGQALVNSLPMILINPLPAMEELNQKYLLKQKAAVAAGNTTELKAWVKRLLTDQPFLQAIKERMQALAKKQAAKEAAKEIIDML